MESMSAKGRKGRRDMSESPDESDSSESHNKHQDSADDVEPGMAVEAREGDLGESDVSTARVKDVERDTAGDVTNIVVEKGVVFRKTLEVPAERIEAVEGANGNGNDSATEPSATSDDSEANAQDSEADEGKVVLNTTK
jgi:hypothetical protein